MTVTCSSAIIALSFLCAGLFAGETAWDNRFAPPPAGLGLDGPVQAIAASGQNVYVAGDFAHAGNVTAHKLARWDGTNWSALGTGLTFEHAYLYCVAAEGSNVWVGGIIFDLDGAPARNVAKWDGTSWSSLGDGIGPVVHALAVHNGEVYAGHGTGDTPIFNQFVLKFDGTNWNPVGGGINSLGHYVLPINAISFAGNDMYVGGDFYEAGGMAATNIAKWDGAQWSTLADGVTERSSNSSGSPIVNSIVAIGRHVYVAGDFTRASGLKVKNLARWDGKSWADIGGAQSTWPALASIVALSELGGDLFAAGTFAQIGGVPATNIGRFQGGSWSPLGSGISGGRVTALASANGKLYVGGDFTSAGGNAAASFAIWAPPQQLQISRQQSQTIVSWPASAIGYVLQTATSIDGPWSETPAPQESNGRRFVRYDNAANRFFRLVNR